MIRSQNDNNQDEIRQQEKTRQMNAEIVKQAEANQSSDYNTKAIATRLRSIAKRRIQNAEKKNLENERRIISGM